MYLSPQLAVSYGAGTGSEHLRSEDFSLEPVGSVPAVVWSSVNQWHWAPRVLISISLIGFVLTGNAIACF